MSDGKNGNVLKRHPHTFISAVNLLAHLENIPASTSRPHRWIAGAMSRCYSNQSNTFSTSNTNHVNDTHN